MNGKAKFITWLLGLLQVIVLTSVLYWAAKVDRVESKVATNAERISHLEAQVEAHYAEILRRLDRIETKVDNVDKSLEGRGDRLGGRGPYLLDGEPGFDGLRPMDADGSSRVVSTGERAP